MSVRRYSFMMTLLRNNLLHLVILHKDEPILILPTGYHYEATSGKIITL